METNKKIVKTVTVTETIELSTDDIEAILLKHLPIASNAEFNWYIGQWVSLTIRSEKIEITEGGEKG